MYEKKEVYIHEPLKQDDNSYLVETNKIGGRLQICKNVCNIFILAKLQLSSQRSLLILDYNTNSHYYNTKKNHFHTNVVITQNFFEH